MWGAWTVRASLVASLLGNVAASGCAGDEQRALLAPGQDQLLGDMLGKGELIAECRFTGGVADGGTIRATYRCSAGEVELEIVHRDAASWRATRTDRFGIRVLNGSPPQQFMGALTSRIRAREVGLRWDWVGQPREDRWWTSPLIIVGLLATMALVWTPFRYGLFNCFVALGLLLAGTLGGVLLIELVLRIAGMERALISPALYLVTSDLPVHRVSSDPFLHYELAPGTEFPGGISHDRNYRVSIDPLGARRPEHPRMKSAGTFRILCFGGSTMYGGSVDDDETIPARLESHLNRLSDAGERTHFEVWNFGTSAYTLGQASHLAHRRLAELDPDLIIVQHHNVGRRPFLATTDFRVDGDPHELQRLDVAFYSEQFAVPERVPMDLHVELLTYSKLYRVLTALMTLVAQRPHWPCSRCDEVSASKARALSVEAEARGVPVLFVAIPADGGIISAPYIFPELAPERFIDLFTPDREPAYYEVHPPADILDEYASSLLGALKARGLLPSM